MTGKEKLRLALAHEEGPVLFDCGGLNTTGMHCITMEKLRVTPSPPAKTVIKSPRKYRLCPPSMALHNCLGWPQSMGSQRVRHKLAAEHSQHRKP